MAEEKKMQMEEKLETVKKDIEEVTELLEQMSGQDRKCILSFMNGMKVARELQMAAGKMPA